MLPGVAVAQDTIKVGILVALEGTFAAGGADGVRNVELASESRLYGWRQEDRNDRRCHRYDAGHHDTAGAQAHRAGQGRYHPRAAFGLGGYRHARLLQDGPGQDRNQRHFRRAGDDMGRPVAELLPLQSGRLAVGLGSRRLRRPKEGLEARRDRVRRLFVRLHQLPRLRSRLLQGRRRNRGSACGFRSARPTLPA